MHHFSQLDAETRQRLFLHEPASFDRHSPVEVLSAALGATLYSPATRQNLLQDIRKQAARGVVSMVLCLEDAIDDREVDAAEANVVSQLTRLAELVEAEDPAVDEWPLLFLRVRHAEQITDLAARLGPALHVLSGFVVPKFTEDSGLPFLEALAEVRATTGLRLFAMPVLESPELAHLESGATPWPGYPGCWRSTASRCSRCASA